MTGFEGSLSFLISVVIFFVVAGGVILVLWIAMPFSLFGVKGLLRELITEQQKTNRLLDSIREESRERGGPPGPGDRGADGGEGAEG